MGDQWYVAWGKKKLGPFSLEELKERARTGRVLPIDMVFQEGTPKWRPASEVEGLCWRTAEKVVQAVPLSPHSQTPISPPTAPTNPGDMVEGIPLPPTPTSPTPLALARDYAEALENLDGGTDVPSPLTNHAPLVPASVNPEDISEPEPLPPLPTNPTPGPPAQAPPESAENLGGAGEAPPTPTTPAPVAPVPPKPEGLGEKLEKRREPIQTGQKLFKWISTAAGVSAVLGLIGDFLRPLVPFNLIAFAATSGLVFFLLVYGARRGTVLGRSFGLVCAVSVSLATGFGVWWGLAYFKGSREKGYLAEHIRVVDRLQSAIINEDEKERLAGVWVRGETELRVKDGRMSWLIQLPDGPARIEAEHGVTRDGVVYGIITRIDYKTTLKEPLPEEDDPFSFQFKLHDDLLIVKDLRGRGFEELKKAAQGRYERRE